MSKTVIYTAITGDYDTLRQPKEVMANTDYICFSSSIREQRIGVWEIRPIPYENKSPIRKSRFPKINPHLVLKEYEASLYVDGNVHLDDNLVDAFSRAVKSGVKCAMVRHPVRSCTYDEALYLIMLGVGEPIRIIRNMLNLLRNGFVRNKGLYSCGIMYRRHGDQAVASFCDEWWRNYAKYSYRDQLTVVSALEKFGVVPANLIDWSDLSLDAVHKAHKANVSHGMLWHGIRFSKRKSAELILRAIYACYGIHSTVNSPYGS